uniref:Uncharacterized protein n=1 Tax=Rhizophora mucronata TaxID=61149 RepID=A0A2P2QLK7_RHIMU
MDMDVLRPEEIDDVAFVQCHQHGSTHSRYGPNYLRLASYFLYVHFLHPAKNCHDKCHCW